MDRSLITLVLSLVGVSVCAAACFVMLAPYHVYQLARRVRFQRSGGPRPMYARPDLRPMRRYS